MEESREGSTEDSSATAQGGCGQSSPHRGKWVQARPLFLLPVCAAEGVQRVDMSEGVDRSFPTDLPAPCAASTHRQGAPGLHAVWS